MNACVPFVMHCLTKSTAFFLNKYFYVWSSRNFLQAIFCRCMAKPQPICRMGKDFNAITAEKRK